MLTREKLERAQALGPVVIDIAGIALADEDRRRLAHPMTGMVILFSRNFVSPAQLSALAAEIHAARPGIVIAVDHEGGRVQRFREGFSAVPAMADIARSADPGRGMAAAGFILASELRACGVDMTYAPVLDLDYGRSQVIGSRSLGRTAAEAAANACALIAGLARGGMACCGKHFPGHGWAEADSHTALPTDERPLAQVKADMAVYRTLSPLLASVMTAHVSYAAFDGEVATYEPRLLKTLLRGELGFEGLIFSDDLSMKGAAGELAPAERAQKALASGCDMVLCCNHSDDLDEILDGLSWTRSAEFSARLAALMPEAAGGEPMTLGELRRGSEWQAARRALEALGFTSAFAAIG